jgi:regulator of replication initiation timing
MNTKEEMYVDHLEEENEKFKNMFNLLSNKILELEKEISSYILDYQVLLDENRYLKQRNKELRQKSWFKVFEENLKLSEENKNLDETCQEVIAEYAKLEKEVEQYKSVLSSVETFIGQYSKEKKGDKGCH